MTTILGIIIGSLISLLIDSSICLLIHLIQKKRGITKKQLALKLDATEKQVQAMENEIKTITQKVDLIIELLHPNH